LVASRDDDRGSTAVSKCASGGITDISESHASYEDNLVGDARAVNLRNIESAGRGIEGGHVDVSLLRIFVAVWIG
jgi:hypothetical protein